MLFKYKYYNFFCKEYYLFTLFYIKHRHPSGKHGIFWIWGPGSKPMMPYFKKFSNTQYDASHMKTHLQAEKRICTNVIDY